MNDTFSIHEDIDFQRKTWIAQRVTWAIMALIVLAAIAGMFGGTMSRVERRESSGRLSVTYERVQRHLAPTQVRVSILAEGIQSPSVQISDSIGKVVEQLAVMPAPRLSTLHAAGPIFTFDAIPSVGGRLDIFVELVPISYGSLAGEIALVEADGRPYASVPISVFVLP